MPLVCQQPWENRATPCASVSLLITAELYQYTHQCAPGVLGLLCSQRCLMLLPPCLLLLSAARCLVLAAAEPGYKAQDCVAQGLFLPSFPLPRLPHCSFPKQRGCGREPVRPCHIPGLAAVPWEWSCSLPQRGHICAISQVAKNKARKSEFGPCGSRRGWEQLWPG